MEYTHVLTLHKSLIEAGPSWMPLRHILEKVFRGQYGGKSSKKVCLTDSRHTFESEPELWPNKSANPLAPCSVSVSEWEKTHREYAGGWIWINRPTHTETQFYVTMSHTPWLTFFVDTQTHTHTHTHKHKHTIKKMQNQAPPPKKKKKRKQLIGEGGSNLLTVCWLGSRNNGIGDGWRHKHTNTARWKWRFYGKAIQKTNTLDWNLSETSNHIEQIVDICRELWFRNTIEKELAQSATTIRRHNSIWWKKYVLLLAFGVRICCEGIVLFRAAAGILASRTPP